MNLPFSNDAPRYGATVLRVALGVMWIAHALLKLLVFTLPGTAAYFETVGIPGVLAVPVFACELVVGIALIAGLQTRRVALASLPLIAGAAWVHRSNGWVHTSPGGGWEYPVFLLVVSIVVALLGGGAWALQRRPARTARFEGA